MRKNQRRFLWLDISIFGMLILPIALLGQASPDSEAIFPATTDWSHHHVIFSRPSTAEQAARLKQDPRYVQQLSRHSQAKLPEAVPEVQFGPNALPREENRNLSGLWEEDLGSGASVGATNYPAKYSFKTNVADCATDFVVYATGLAGSAKASIVAYNNLYSGCGGTVPSVYWAYNTGAPILTSPVFSRDGTQIAFVQSNASGHGVVVLLKWVASTTESVTSPGTPANLTNPTLYPACTAPCMLKVDLSDSGVLNNDTNSSVFYDYSNDVAYVGDDGGFLHKFTPFFLGIPKEVTVGWPVQVNPGAPTALISPVHDFVSGNVFVADNGGFLYRVDPTGAVTTSGQLDFSVSEDGGPGIVQGPVIDPSAGLIYVFATSDGSGACPIGLPPNSDCSAVIQLSTSFLALDTGTEAVVGTSTPVGTAPEPMYIGGFDIAYENSTDPPTGNLYVCGNTGGNPILYQVLITAGAFGTVNPGPPLSATITTPCSPVTDVFNPNASGGATEWVFASVETDGPSSACLGITGHGCIFNFKDTAWKPLTSYSVGQEVVDTHFQIQVVIKAGTSGATAPSWQTLPGKITNDPNAAGVHWIDQGVASAFPLAAWAPNHLYSKGQKILDNNNPQNIQLVTSSGARNSGGTMPTFNSTPGGTTPDGTGGLVWTNVGVPATAALAAAGGTSGVIIDNTVSTLAGASNVYFSTLGNQTCGTSGTGGCAVQASQSGLK